METEDNIRKGKTKGLYYGNSKDLGFVYTVFGSFLPIEGQ